MKLTLDACDRLTVKATESGITEHAFMVAAIEAALGAPQHPPAPAPSLPPPSQPRPPHGIVSRIAGLSVGPAHEKAGSRLIDKRRK